MDPTHGRAKAGRPARTYIQQLCEDMGCCPEDLPEAMNDREKWRERVRDIRATSTTWWRQIDVCHTTSLNRHLHHHAFRQNLVVLWHYTDNCTTTFLTGLWVYHFVLTVNRNPVVTLLWEKVTNTQNTVLVRSYKNLFATASLSSCREERNRVWKMSQRLQYRQWERNFREKREEVDTDRNVIILVFCCCSCTCFFGIWSSHLRNGSETTSRISPQNGKFSDVFKSLCLIPNYPFAVFCSAPTPPLFYMTFFRPIRIRRWSDFNPGVRCSPDLDLENPHSTSHSFLPFSLSLCLLALILFLIYVSFISSFQWSTS